MAGSPGMVLVSTVWLVAAVFLLGVAMFTVLKYEAATVRAHERAFRAELAAASGLSAAIAEITGFLQREDVGGAAFTTWAYAAPSGGYHVALTAGRPEKTHPATPWLDTANTFWPGGTGDPDELRAMLAAGSPAVLDMNADGKICADLRPLAARWQEISTAPGQAARFAVWVDDESARIDLAKVAEVPRLAGASAAELPIPGSTALGPPVSTRKNWVTSPTARQLLGPAHGLTRDDDFLTTVFSTGYRVVQWAPPGPPPARAAARGMPRRNLNWKGWVETGRSAEERVEKLATWMRTGAPDFHRHGAPSFWPAAPGQAAPVFSPPLADVAAHAFIRDNQMATIAASIVDYLDPDATPTQPGWLAQAAVHLPGVAETDVLFQRDFELPGFFGADRCPRINEVQILWNCAGASDGYKARPTVQRATISPGLFEYTIPVTLRVELWNMDKLPVPPQAYALRVFFMQQIRGSAFGSTGAMPIPESTEQVALLNGGNPLGFAPNEFKVFEITRIHVRRGNIDRGITWDAFRNGQAGTADDEPDGHQRQAHVLCDPASGAWFHATGYKAMAEAPVDGVCSAGIGGAGALLGNKINDPRMEPLRAYALDATTGASHAVHDAERDGGSNKPGKIGSINNKTGTRAFNYQDTERWMDRPAFDDPVNPREGITRVGNRLPPSAGAAPVETNRFLSAGELGRIFDPGWVHPDGRGGNDTGGFAYHQGCRSGFRGGATLRVGQPDGMDRLAANSWNVLDLFDTDPGPWGTTDTDEFLTPVVDGRVNVNVSKRLPSGKSVIESVFTLPALLDGPPGDAADTFDVRLLREKIEARMTHGGADGIGGTIRSWKHCRPFFSTGELSELAVWEDPALYHGKVAAIPGQPAGLNRGDAGREEIFARSSRLLATASHVYRFTVTGSTGRITPSGDFHEAARRTRQYVVFFECDFDAKSGELAAVRPRVLLQKDL